MATLLLGTLAVGALSEARVYAQSTAAEALKKARALERLADQPPQASKTAEAPSFVVDPGWPKPLPHNWIIGDVGGITVDTHDHIWVYHRPRSLNSTDSGAQGVAGKDEAGNPISALGFRRPYGRLSGCCDPAPSVLEFDKDGNLLQAWGGPERSRLPRKEVPHPGRLHLAGARAWHLRRPQRLRLHFWQRPGARFPRAVSVGAELRQRFPHPEIHA